MKRNKCISCGGGYFKKDLIFLEDIPAYAESVSEQDIENGILEVIDMGLCQCSMCGLIQIDCEPVDYYRDCIRASSVSDVKAGKRKKQYEQFISDYNLQGKNVVEIGCGHGEFLRLWEGLPVKAYGVENGKEGYEEAKKTCGKVEQAFIGDERFISANAPYDAFVCHNYLEHQPDPNAFIQGIYRNTSTDAVGIIEVPDFDYCIEDRNYYELIHDHVAYYTRKTIQNLLERNGFEIVDIRNIDKIVLSVTVKKIQCTNGRGLQEAYEDVKNDIKELANKFGTLALWGASHHGFMLAKALRDVPIKYIIDSSERKQGRLSPGSHLKIVPPSYFWSDPAGLIIISTAVDYYYEISNIITEKYGSVPRAVIKKGRICMLTQNSREEGM